MSPMCMYSCFDRDGKITDFHRTHYISRVVGQVGLIIFEASAVVPNGRISYEDLGIWSDDHVAGLKSVVDAIHEYGSRAGIQIAHAGRKAQLNERIDAPSAVAFEGMQVPHELTVDEIQHIVQAFGDAARRAQAAGFDVLEIHAAHGYLINEFLSPLSNFRTDAYGGSVEKRYTFLKEVIDAVKQEWSGIVFVRISATEYAEGGNTPETFVTYAQYMKAQGVDLIDCSSGGVVPAKIKAEPNYQVPAATLIRNEADIPTGAVGLITSGKQAEAILQNNQADMIIIGRELLRNPYWVYAAATELGAYIPSIKQYARGWVAPN